MKLSFNVSSTLLLSGVPSPVEYVLVSHVASFARCFMVLTEASFSYFDYSTPLSLHNTAQYCARYIIVGEARGKAFQSSNRTYEEFRPDD